MKHKNLLFAFFILFASFLYFILQNNQFDEEIEDPLNISKKLNERKSNPKPPRTNNKYESLYIAVYDDEYEPKDYHCLMKKQWIDPLSKNKIIDGIEFFSLNAWDSDECNLSTITVKRPPKFMKDPSSWQVYQIMKQYIERSNSAWLYLVGSAAYIRIDEFIRMFSHLLEDYTDESAVMARGCCIEPSYYFQLLQISSGVFLTRKAVQKMLALNDFWNTTFAIEIDGNEALGHALNSIGITISYSNIIGMIGDEFFDEKDMRRLVDKNFDGLPDCTIREDLLNPAPGNNGNCIKDVQLFLSLIVWAGGGKSNRYAFLKNAQRMIENSAPNLGVIWERTKPKLCLL